LIVFKHSAGEAARSECAGIYIDTIVPNVGLANWRMTVNDEFPEAALVAEKIFPDPQKVFISLLGQRNARPHAGMDKKIIP
jgi:hypothetical protein